MASKHEFQVYQQNGIQNSETRFMVKLIPPTSLVTLKCHKNVFFFFLFWMLENKLILGNGMFLTLLVPGGQTVCLLHIMLLHDLSVTILSVLSFLLVHNISAAITSLNSKTFYKLSISLFWQVIHFYPFNLALRGFIKKTCTSVVLLNNENSAITAEP